MTMTTSTRAPEVPEVRDELIRKTVEFMVRLQEQFDHKTIDPAIAAAQCKALWHVTSGLVSEDISALLAQQADAIGPRPVKRFFAGHGKVLLLAFLPEGCGYVLQKISPQDGSRTQVKRSDSEVGFREQEIADLTDALKRQGYAPI